MKNIISSMIKSVQLFCYAFSCPFSTGFQNKALTGSFVPSSIHRWPLWHQRFVFGLAFIAILLSGQNTLQAQNIKGIVPVITPIGGNAMDGNALAHQPTNPNDTPFKLVGDIFDENYGAGAPGYDTGNPTALHNINHGLVDITTGVVLHKPGPNPETQGLPVSYHFKDPYTNDPTIFTSSNKINDNPNTYTWGPGSSPNKNELQNCGAHFTYGDPNIMGGVTDSDGHFIGASAPNGTPGVSSDVWCTFAADRQVTNGSSYIDFEFLQAPLRITNATYGPPDPKTGIPPIISGSGAFQSDAPNSTGGRTVGDLLITIEFTNGGGEATVVLRQWQKVGAIYQYVVIPNTDFFGYIFCTNNNVSTTVPFEVYGHTPGSYEPNQWAEGAINITQVLNTLKNPCTSISTLFIRTRSSGSAEQSELKDFPGAPIQLNLDLKPDLPTAADVAFCGPGLVDVTLTASGCEDGTLKWFTSVDATTAIATGETYTPSISATTHFWVSCTSKAGCEGPRKEVIATLNPATTATAGLDQAKCQTKPTGPTSFTLAGTASGGTSEWTQVGQTGTAQATITTPSSPTSTVSVAGIGTVTLRITTTSNSTPVCPPSWDEVTLTVNANPTATAGMDEAKCQTKPSGPTIFTLAGTASNGTSAWTQVGQTGTAQATVTTPSSPTSDVSVAGIGTVTLRITTTSNANPICDAAWDEVTLTVNANPTATAGMDQAKCQTKPTGPTSFTLAGTASGGTSAWTQVGQTGTAQATVTTPSSPTSVVSVAGIGTVTLRITTTSNANPVCDAAWDEVTLTVNANPTATAGMDQAKCQTKPSGPTSFTLAGTATNGTSAWTQVGQTGTAQASITTPASPTSAVEVSGIGTVTLRITTTSNANPVCDAAWDEVTLTVNANPTATAGMDQAKCQTKPSGPTSFTLEGTASGGTSAWTQVGQTGTAQATVTTPGSPTSAVSVAGIGTVTLRITTTSNANPVCDAAWDEVTLTVNANPTATAGMDQAKCQTKPSGPTSFTLAGTASNGTSAWTQVGQTGTAQASITTPGSPTSAVNVSGIGTVTLRITTTSNANPVCDAAWDEVTLTVNANPTATAGMDQTLCQTKPSGPTSFTLAGTASNGTSAWTQVGQTGTAQASITTPGSPTSAVSVSGIGTVTLRITTTSNANPVCDAAWDEVTLTVTANATANAGDNQVKCQTKPAGPTSFTLAGQASNGTTQWSVFSTTGTASASIVSPTSLSSVVNVSGIGTVTLRLTTSSDCGNAEDDVILTVNANPTATAGMDQTKCQTPPSGPTSFTLAGTASNGTSAWTEVSHTGDASASIADASSPTSTVNVSGTGTVTLRITTTSNADPSCGTAWDEVTLTVNPNATAYAGEDQEKCKNAESNSTSFTLAGTSTNGTAQWSVFGSTGTASASIVSINSLSSNVNITGTGTVTLRLTTSSDCGNVHDDVILTVIANPTPLVLTGSLICPTAQGTGSVSSTTSQTGVWYQLKLGNTNIQNPMQGTGSALMWSNLDAGANYHVVSTGPEPTNCPGTSNSVAVAFKACSAAICTYTQGAYGNAGGKGCAEGQQYSTYDLIAKALSSYPDNTMRIGLDGHSVWMKGPDDINAIISVLPGGGGSKVLFSGNAQISNLSPNYLKNGKLNNTLLAQTITLGLNLGIDGALGDLKLEAGTFAVAQPEGGCGSNIPKTRQCSPGGFGPVLNEYKYYTISNKLIQALTDDTVDGLFALANQALGGGDTHGLTLSEIASAVDLINNAFDECRIFVGYGIEPLTCATMDQSMLMSDTARIADTSAFTASPVPFKDQLTISYNFNFVTDVRIEVFNIIGTLVASNYDTNGYLNKSVLLNIPTTGQEEMYVIKLTTNQGSSIQKVLASF